MISIGDHLNLAIVLMTYGAAGFFLCCLIAGALGLFGLLRLDSSVRKYLYGGLLVSLGGVVITTLGGGAVTPQAIQSKINTVIRSEASDIVEDQINKKTVYIQIPNETDRATADQLRSALIKDGFAAPGIENTGSNSPSNLQIRHYSEDLDQAKKIAKIMVEMGIGEPELKTLSGERTSGAIEVWFPRN